MAKLVKCKDCDHEVSKRAKTCPNCGVSKPAVKSIGGAGSLLVIIIGAFVVIGMVAGDGSGSSGSYQKTPAQVAAEKARKVARDRETMAIVIAEDAIEKQLKSPSTADFSGVRDTRSGRLEDGGPNDWVVIGYVDAQNGFGAMIRSNYQVVIEFEEGRSDSYRIKSANLLER